MPNPYVYKEPLKGRQGFFNRNSEITRVTSRIAADRPQSISIVGAPRAGKTSLLNYLYDPESRAGYLDDPPRYLFLLLKLMEVPPDSPPAFFALVDAALQQEGEGSMKPTYEGFEELVKRLMQEARKLIVFCDDFGLVTSNSKFPLDFFSIMRSVANSNDVGYVTTSYAPLQQLCYTPDIEESPFFNIFTTVNLEPFKDEEARRLVEAPAREAGEPFATETEWILKLAGAWPYLLQLTASLAFEARVNGRLEREALGAQAFKEAREFMETNWAGGHFPEAQQEVMRAVLAGKEVELRYQFDAESLERRGLLRREGKGYVFSAGLWERFVKEQGSGRFWKRLFG